MRICRRALGDRCRPQQPAEPAPAKTSSLPSEIPSFPKLPGLGPTQLSTHRGPRDDLKRGHNTLQTKSTEHASTPGSPDDPRLLCGQHAKARSPGSTTTKRSKEAPEGAALHADHSRASASRCWGLQHSPALASGPRDVSQARPCISFQECEVKIHPRTEEDDLGPPPSIRDRALQGLAGPARTQERVFYPQAKVCTSASEHLLSQHQPRTWKTKLHCGT